MLLWGLGSKSREYMDICGGGVCIFCCSLNVYVDGCFKVFGVSYRL